MGLSILNKGNSYLKKASFGAKRRKAMKTVGAVQSTVSQLESANETGRDELRGDADSIRLREFRPVSTEVKTATPSRAGVSGSGTLKEGEVKGSRLTTSDGKGKVTHHRFADLEDSRVYQVSSFSAGEFSGATTVREDKSTGTLTILEADNQYNHAADFAIMSTPDLDAKVADKLVPHHRQLGLMNQFLAEMNTGRRVLGR